MILLKTQEEIELIRDSARLLGETLAEVGRHIRPGVTTALLDKIGEQYIRDNGGIPLCKGYEGFPSAFCISVNDVVVHGIPSDDFFIKDSCVFSHKELSKFFLNKNNFIFIFFIYIKCLEFIYKKFGTSERNFYRLYSIPCTRGYFLHT